MNNEYLKLKLLEVLELVLQSIHHEVEAEHWQVQIISQAS